MCSIVIPRAQNANNFSETKAGMQIIGNFPFVFHNFFVRSLHLFIAHGRKIEWNNNDIDCSCTMQMAIFSLFDFSRALLCFWNFTFQVMFKLSSRLAPSLLEPTKKYHFWCLPIFNCFSIFSGSQIFCIAIGNHRWFEFGARNAMHIRWSRKSVSENG